MIGRPSHARGNLDYLEQGVILVWQGRKVLVTGGAGFLGSNLCHELASRGARVVALDGSCSEAGPIPQTLRMLMLS
jgi:FlaA1/EpsC-like NDP-sugar epimerase